MQFTKTNFHHEEMRALHNDAQKAEEHNGWFNYSLAAISIVTVLLVNLIK